jgi:hypothetical protein
MNIEKEIWSNWWKSCSFSDILLIVLNSSPPPFPSKSYQGWFWIENIITENQWKIAETIYTPFQMVYFWPVLTVFSKFRQFLFRRKLAEIIPDRIQLSNLFRFVHSSVTTLQLSNLLLKVALNTKNLNPNQTFQLILWPLLPVYLTRYYLPLCKI